MKKILVFLWRASIPLLWLFSVWLAIRGGFEPGLLPPGQTYPYPYAGVYWVCMITAIESGFLYLILQPHNYTWSLIRCGIALAIFFALSYLSVITYGTDQAGFVYVPGFYALLLTFLLFILFIVTLINVVVKRFGKKT